MHTEVAGVRIDFAEGSHREGVRCVCFLVIDIGIGVVVFLGPMLQFASWMRTDLFSRSIFLANLPLLGPPLYNAFISRCDRPTIGSSITP